MTDTPPPDRVAPPREIGEFLIELSIALHKYGMYPSGHPSLEPACASVAARTAKLLGGRDQLVFGVGRRQMIYEGAPTDASQPLIRRLAEALHKHHLGALTLVAGLSAAEIDGALRELSKEPEQAGAFGLRPAETRPAWPHLKLHPLSFDGLALAGDRDGTGDGQGRGGAEAPGGAELWVALAEAAVSGGDAAGSLSTDPDELAKSIDAHAREEAYERVITGYLLQIARELKHGAGSEAVSLQRSTARLIAALNPDTLRHLVHMGGNAAQRGAFLHDATQGMAAEAVIRIVKAAADAGGQTISHGLIRMLSKLAVHAEFGAMPARPKADVALREQVSELLAGWRLENPNPEAYGAVLEQVASGTQARLPDDEPGTDRVDPIRVVQISLESGDTGPLVERAVDRAIAQGLTTDLLATLSARPPDAAAVAESVLSRLLRPDAVRALVTPTGVDFDSLDRLQPFLTADGYGILLDALATADNRTTRRKLLDRLAQAPVDLGPMIVARLEDSRWFVQRNMLVLLERSERLPEGFTLPRWTSHPDLRVRHEAIRLQLKVPAERHLAVRAALQSGHPRLAHSGLAAIQQECPASLADLVGALALDAAADEEARVLAARALGRCRDRRALASLLELTDGGRSLLGRARLAPKSPVMLAALQALAAGWRADARAASVLQLASKAAEADVRRAAQGGAR